MAAFINDHFVKNEDALIHISDLSMQRGYAVFDFSGRLTEYRFLWMTILKGFLLLLRPCI